MDVNDHDFNYVHNVIFLLSEPHVANNTRTGRRF